MKSYQVKTTIVNCTDIQLEGLKILTAHRIDVVIAKTMWINYTILNQMRSFKGYYRGFKRNTQLNTGGIFESSNVPITINTRVL